MTKALRLSDREKSAAFVIYAPHPPQSRTGCHFADSPPGFAGGGAPLDANRNQGVHR